MATLTEWEPSRWRRSYGRALRAEVIHAAASYGPQYRWTVYPAHTEVELAHGFCSSLESAQTAVDAWVTELADAAVAQVVASRSPVKEG